MKKKKFKVIISIIFIISVIGFIPVCVKADSNYLQVGSFFKEKVSNTFLIAADACDNTPLGCVDKDTSVAWLLQKILDYIKILGPTIAVVLGSIDFAKAIIMSDEENMKKTEARFIKRMVAAAILFFIPMLVSILLEVVGLTGSTGGLS